MRNSWTQKRQDLTFVQGLWLAVIVLVLVFIAVILGGWVFMLVFNHGIVQLATAFGGTVSTISFNTAIWGWLTCAFIGRLVFGRTEIKTS